MNNMEGKTKASIDNGGSVSWSIPNLCWKNNEVDVLAKESKLDATDMEKKSTPEILNIVSYQTLI